jgi:hypothetical protein
VLVIVIVGFTTTYVISVYHHWCCEFESSSGRGAQHYVIKFVSDLQQVGGFSLGSSVSSTNKTDRHDIASILLKVALNTIKPKTYIILLSFHIISSDGGNGLTPKPTSTVRLTPTPTSTVRLTPTPTTTVRTTTLS